MAIIRPSDSAQLQRPKVGTGHAYSLGMSDAIKEAARQAWLEQSDVTEANRDSVGPESASAIACARLRSAGFLPSYSPDGITVWCHPVYGQIVQIDAGFLGTLTRYVQ
jgi:hypothetical protein